ncbi:MAG TPA: FkbM family methyltransferase [Saprospiraceae bacterium]|nr:FkbM family methyltransferase [Saprospiraceae bacterium]
MFDIIKKFIRTIPIPLSKNHAYDLQTINVIKKHCLPNSNCIDIGCHKGEILDLILQHAPHGQHFAFEPLPDFYKNLKKKYQQYPNVKIFDIALNNNKGKTTFNYVISNPAYSGIVKRKYDRANEKDMLIEVIAVF